MSKKTHPLEGLSTILGSLKGDAAPPSPAPLETPSPTTSRKALPPEKTVEPAPRGRPRSGKKSDPDYVQTSILIKDETRLRVKQALLGGGSGLDMSQLVQQLLENWLESHS
jgi:hypothetical protein